METTQNDSHIFPSPYKPLTGSGEVLRLKILTKLLNDPTR